MVCVCGVVWFRLGMGDMQNQDETHENIPITEVHDSYHLLFVHGPQGPSLEYPPFRKFLFLYHASLEVRWELCQCFLYGPGI